MRPIRLLAATIALLATVSIVAAIAGAVQTGNLKLDVLGKEGAGAKNPAHLIAANGKEAGQVTPGSSIALPPGEYKLVMPIVGGQIVKDGVQIEAGRTPAVRGGRRRGPDPAAARARPDPGGLHPAPVLPAAGRRRRPPAPGSRRLDVPGLVHVRFAPVGVRARPVGWRDH